jgi:hypothetical protein
MPSTVADFRRYALALPNAIESAHMGHPDFRHVDARGTARIFATLSAQERGYGVLKLTLEQQQLFIDELPNVFEPVQGGWGRMGMTYIRLAAADNATLEGALGTAYRNIASKQAAKIATKKIAKSASSAAEGPKIARTAAKKSGTVRTKARPRKKA